jgi:hypothetical protein
MPPEFFGNTFHLQQVLIIQQGTLPANLIDPLAAVF